MIEKATIKSSLLRIDLDKAGATASLACAVHCALMPIVITLLPLLARDFFADNRLEWAMLGLSALLGSSSLCLGYREHRKRRALLILSLGLTALVMGRILEERRFETAGVVGVVMGGFAVAAAHFVNRKLCRSCRECRANDPSMSADC
ncbi:MAG: MerC domain-containing protein [Capsulimonas sp.]|uniref:MerC domain-containing protein n=1 Tax=Capsulimonas sp. TaxID=2494211 RepID=UPI003266CB00